MNWITLLKPRNIVGLAIILLVIFSIIQTQRALHFQEESERNAADLKVVTGLVNGKEEQTKFYVNQFQEQVGKTKKMELSKQTLEALMKSKEAEWIKKFDAKPKQIESATHTEVSIDGENILLIPMEDTIVYRKTFLWKIKDEYNDILARVVDTPRLRINIPLYELEIWQRKKFLGLRIGKKEWYKEITSPNKLVKLNSQVIYTVRKKGRHE